MVNQIFLTDTSLTSWTVPNDWNNASNLIECISGGGGGFDATGNVGTGGEGGHYAASPNLTLTIGATILIQVGTAGTHGNPATKGGDTYFQGTSLSTSTIGAVGGAAATGNASNATTSTSFDRGATIYQGGFGSGWGPNNEAGSGGGGAAGPGGIGGDSGDGANTGGGGGGSGNTGGPGSNGINSGDGGAAGDGTAGGVTPGGNGSDGSGGAGGQSAHDGGDGGTGSDTSWGGSHGPGGGGGGGGNTGSGATDGGPGGLYGGAGGGAAWAGGHGANGAQGIIVITYDPVPTEVSIDGQFVTVEVGELGFPWEPSIDGQSVTMSVGDFTIETHFDFIGNQAGASVGTVLVFSGPNTGSGTATGQQIAASVGSYGLVVQPQPTGNQATAQVGNPTILIFKAGFQMASLTCTQIPVISTDAYVTMRVSFDKGASWSFPVTRPLGAVGEYLTNVMFRPIGIGRDPVVELSWSCPRSTSLGNLFMQFDIGTS